MWLSSSRSSSVRLTRWRIAPANSDFSRSRAASFSLSSDSRPSALANSSSMTVSPGASTSGRRGLELGGLSGQRLARVVLRERHLHRAGLAGADADHLVLKTGDELAGADHELNALALAAVERHAVDGADEVDGDAVALLGLGALGLRRIGPALVGDALDRLVDVAIGHVDHRLLDIEALEVGERDRRHDLDRDGVGQIGLAGEQVLDLLLLGRHRDLGLGREAEAALGEDLRVGVADGLVDGLGHHRAAVDLLQMRHRHLAGTEAVEADLVLQVDQARVGLGVEVGRGNADLEFVLQSLVEGLGDLHGVNLLFAFVRPCGRALFKMLGAGRDGLAPVVRRTKSRSEDKVLQNSSGKRSFSAWCGRRDSNPHNFRHWNLNPARLPVPPRPLE